MGLQCNERQFDCKYVALQSFPSHCRTKKTSHQIRVIRGFYVVTQLTEQNQLCHRGCCGPKVVYRGINILQSQVTVTLTVLTDMSPMTIMSQGYVTHRDNSDINTFRLSLKYTLCVTECTENK